MRQILVLTASLMAFLISTAQIVPTSEVVDFGLIKEVDGPKTVRVYVKNIGTEPQTILKVKPTCGCTAADFQKTPFAPGDSAWIDLTYNPVRRPGAFTKSVKVYPTEGNMIDVDITGTVIASEGTLSHMFPVNLGCLRLTEDSFTPLRPLTKEVKCFMAGIYNTCDHDLYIAVENADEAIGIDVVPFPLPPGHKGMIEISLNPLRETRTGSLEYLLHLFTAENAEGLKNAPSETLKINVVIEPEN